MFDLYVIKVINPTDHMRISVREGRTVFRSDHIDMILSSCAALMLACAANKRKPAQLSPSENMKFISAGWEGRNNLSGKLQIKISKESISHAGLCARLEGHPELISDDVLSVLILMTSGAIGSFDCSLFKNVKALKDIREILNQHQNQIRYTIGNYYHHSKEKILFLTLGGGKYPNGSNALLKVLNQDRNNFTDMDSDLLSVKEQDELDDETRNDILKIANEVSDKKERSVRIRTRLMQYGMKTGKLEDFVYAYQDTKYQFPDGSEYHSQLVAEPLIHYYHPDRIFMIGTAGSMWADLYLKFSAKIDPNEYADILRIIQLGSSKTGLRQMHQIQKKLSCYFTADRLKDGIPDIVPVLVRYGYNARQQEENYNILSGVWENGGFTEGIEYETSFDITHSFRSLPIYNMVIMNYYRLVSDYQINISHIFYGNQEAIHEIGYAPIMDLSGMENILELSNAVSTFKTTGSASQLISVIGAKDKPLTNALNDFNWALTINDLDGTVAGIARLMKVCSSKSKKESAYTDLRHMIKVMIETSILKDACMSMDQITNVQKYPEARAEIQYLLTGWLLQNKQYGIASADAQESLLSYLALLRCQIKKLPVTTKEIAGSKTRDQIKDKVTADDVLTYLSENDKKLFKKIRSEFCDARDVRNGFAHNLSSDIDKHGNEIDQIRSPEEVLKSVTSIYKRVGDIRRNYLNQKNDPSSAAYIQQLCRIYFIKPKIEVKKPVVQKSTVSSTKVKKQPIPSKPANIRKKIVISIQKRTDYAAYAKASKRKFEVDKLPDSVLKLIQADYRSNDISSLFHTGLIIADVLRHSNFPPAYSIYLLDLSPLQNTVYQYALTSSGFKNVTLQDAKRQNLKLDKLSNEEIRLCLESKKAYESEKKKTVETLVVVIS